MHGEVGRGPAVDVTLFVPCYNEEANIVACLTTTVAACRQVGCTYQVLVFDDGSTDRSVELVRGYQAAHPDAGVELVVNPVNRGLSRNFAEAARVGRGEFIRIVCGDNVEPLATQVAILSRMRTADMVIPYPVRVENKTAARMALSKVYVRLVNAAAGRRLRYWNGCALVRRADVVAHPPNTRGFGFQALLVSKLLSLGRTYVEVGCHYHERVGGQSKAVTLKNLRSVAHVLATIVAHRPRPVFFLRPRSRVRSAA